MSARALLLVHESKDRGCHYAYHLYEELSRLEHVADAYPLIGGVDGSVWIEAPDMEALVRAVRNVQATPGIRHTEALIATPDTP